MKLVSARSTILRSTPIIEFFRVDKVYSRFWKLALYVK